MTREEAIAVVAKAIRSGIFNDLGSGSNVDLCVISEGGKKVDYLRNYEKLQGRTYARQQPVVFAKGTARACLSFVPCILCALPPLRNPCVACS
jgi:20S proteasome subunit beta 2